MIIDSNSMYTEPVTVNVTKQILMNPVFMKGESALKIHDNVNMVCSEKGSYFWLEKIPEPAENLPELLPCLPVTDDWSYTFSGRSAIELAVLDIMNSHNIKKAYVPAYCCESMLQPFRRQNIELEFYNVSFADGCFRYDIDVNTDADAVLILSYFGFQLDTVHTLINEFHRNGVIVIEDITHSLLSNNSCSEKSDYLVASLRKWFSVPAGGWVGKHSNTLYRKPDTPSNCLVGEKLCGMLKKWEYISGKSADKADFFRMQTNFEKIFPETDSSLLMDGFTCALLCQTDTNKTALQRRMNADILRKGLQKFSDRITYPSEELSHISPLFFPVFLNTADRDSLRSWLIGKNVYCPVHWSVIDDAECDILNHELSLICDQRYSAYDMQEIVSFISEWYEKE